MKSVFFETNGNLSIAADVDGKPTAPPVILLHGGGQTRHSWKKTFDRLVAEGYLVISMDLRGHGDSEWAPDQNYTLDAFSSDLRNIAAKLPRKPALVGASLGGLVSLLCEAESQQLASALILVDVAPQIEAIGVDKIMAFMNANRSGFSSVEEAIQAVREYNPQRQHSSSMAGIRKNLRNGIDGRLYWHWDPAFVSGDHREKARTSGRRLLEAAGEITIPTMLIRGQQSDVVSMEGVNQLREKIPHMEFVEIPGAGHMVAGDSNDLFSSAIINFLGKHSAPIAAR